jgi:hypothetical protein
MGGNAAFFMYWPMLFVPYSTMYKHVHNRALIKYIYIYLNYSVYKQRRKKTANAIWPTRSAQRSSKKRCKLQQLVILKFSTSILHWGGGGEGGGGEDLKL